MIEELKKLVENAEYFCCYYLRRKCIHPEGGDVCTYKECPLTIKEAITLLEKKRDAKWTRLIKKNVSIDT